ncbi:MAG: hypothetical protein FJX80_07955 [Bacteroidetes bacterium]|nr:hypothetical protein [Bacteroidota bacterium]
MIQFKKHLNCSISNKKQEARNMAYSKTRTTYRPSTHPSCNNHKDLVISIIVTPAPTYHELCTMSTKDYDAISFQNEIKRCAPITQWMKLQGKIQPTPTQHARIDPAQVKELSDLLHHNTLHLNYVSMMDLMMKIQCDLHGK